MATVAVDSTPVEALERRLEDFLSRYERGRQENASLKQELGECRTEIIELTQEGKAQRGEIASLRAEIAELKGENATLRAEGSQLKTERESIKDRITRLIGQVDERLVQTA